jgi:predicted nucleic acid-binding protein
MMKTTTKPTIYVETSVISYLTNRPSTNAITLGRQLLTRQWWEAHRHKYDLSLSDYVLQELIAGDEAAVAKRVEAIDGIRELSSSDPAIEQLAQTLIAKKGLPAKAKLDALHIATSAVHRIEYLASWNFTHIVNIHQMRKIQAICADAGYPSAQLVTLDQLE